VLDLGEAVDYHHNRARNAYVEVDGVMQPAPAPRFSRTPAAKPQPAQDLTDDEGGVLTRWGLNADDIQSLRETGAVR
ncbi:MAG: CoA transferase, partial [Hyphomonadaceae bacterium]